MADTIKEVLRAIASGLQIPTIIILLILIAVTIIMLGSLIAEFFTERRRMKAKIPELIDNLQGKNTKELWEEIEKSGLLKRHKAALKELIDRGSLPQNTREALARQLLFNEETHYEKTVKITDVIARIGPMFGLLGTLIPLGPGLIALGQGDMETLSSCMLSAFDSTIAGLISAAVAYVISVIRKKWYEYYTVSIETVMECILEQQGKEELNQDEQQIKNGKVKRTAKV